MSYLDTTKIDRDKGRIYLVYREVDFFDYSHGEYLKSGPTNAQVEQLDDNDDNPIGNISNENLSDSEIEDRVGINFESGFVEQSTLVTLDVNLKPENRYKLKVTFEDVTQVIEETIVVESVPTPSESSEVTSGIQPHCGMASIVLHFIKSGLKIQPFEADIMKDKGQLDYGRIRLSREAGQLISNKAFTREPVEITSDGTTIGRFMYPDEGLEIGTDEAHLELLDELKILQHVEINKTFSGNWKLKDVIDYIFSSIQSEDRHGILTDWKESKEDLSDDTATTVEGGPLDGFMGHLENATNSESIIVGVGDWLERKARNRYDFLQDDVDFDFEEESGLSVINKISEEFKLDIFTKDDGIMYIGSQEDEFQIFEGSMLRGSYNLINYSVPSANNRIKGVVVEGQDILSLEHDGLWNVITDDNKVYMHGLALRNDIDNGDIVLTQHDSRNPDSLQQVAENHLTELISQDESGTVEVDLLSSGIPEGQPDIRKAKIDDSFIVTEHEGRCQRITPGYYLIDSIQHQINPMDGWIISIGLKGMIIDEIDTAAFGYDTSEGQVVEEMSRSGVYWGDASMTIPVIGGEVSGTGFNFISQEDISTDIGEDIGNEL